MQKAMMVVRKLKERPLPYTNWFIIGVIASALVGVFGIAVYTGDYAELPVGIGYTIFLLWFSLAGSIFITERLLQLLGWLNGASNSRR